MVSRADRRKRGRYSIPGHPSIYIPLSPAGSGFRGVPTTGLVVVLHGGRGEISS